jgi:hypothetical protein
MLSVDLLLPGDMIDAISLSLAFGGVGQSTKNREGDKDVTRKGFDQGALYSSLKYQIKLSHVRNIRVWRRQRAGVTSQFNAHLLAARRDALTGQLTPCGNLLYDDPRRRKTLRRTGIETDNIRSTSNRMLGKGGRQFV